MTDKTGSSAASNLNATASKPTLGTDAPVMRLGRKCFALALEPWKGQMQARLQEVTPRTEGLAVIGWDRVYDGVQLVGKPDELRDFLSGARQALVQALTPRKEA